MRKLDQADHALIASITSGLGRQLGTAGRLRIWFPPGFVVVKVDRSRQPMGYARPGLITYLLTYSNLFRLILLHFYDIIVRLVWR